MTSSVAIDFGTTRTKLAYRPEKGRPELMRFEHDRPYAPSLFYLARDTETILWGEAAEEMLSDDPAGVVDVLKRKLREAQIRVGRRREAPQRLLTYMLSELRRKAGEQVAALEGRAPARAVLTLPALYGPVEEKILREAAGEAGFAEVELVAEPVAAARAWLAETGEAAEEVVVFDAGGGTLDWAYLRRTDDDFCIVPECPPGGDRLVGGHDIDMELLNLLRDELDDRVAEKELTERQVHYLAELRVLKERLGRGLPPKPLRVGPHSVTLDELKMRARIEERFVAQACIGLGSYLKQVRAARGAHPVPVLLVGGSSRLEGLQAALEQRLGCTTVRWERSEYATVLGGVRLPANQIRLSADHIYTRGIEAYRKATDQSAQFAKEHVFKVKEAAEQGAQFTREQASKVKEVAEDWLEFARQMGTRAGRRLGGHWTKSKESTRNTRNGGPSRRGGRNE